MKNKQTSELPLEREFLLEEMRRFLQVNPEEAAETALEIYEAYLNLSAQYLQVKQRVRTRIETPPFFGQ